MKRKAIPHEITIPEGLPELDGSLSRSDRVAIALDVIALLKSRQRKFHMTSTYFDSDELPGSGQLHSSLIKGQCDVCARGILFIKSIDRFDQFDLGEVDGFVDNEDVLERTENDFGTGQAELIESVFEGSSLGPAWEFYNQHGGWDDRKAVMIAICENMVANHGEFKLS